MKRTLQIFLACCAVFCWAGSAVGQAYDTCAHLRALQAKSSNYTDTVFWHQAYDSIRLYIEKCATKYEDSYLAFDYIDNAVKFMSSETTRYDTYRAWLISVLYLAPTYPAYYCNCMGSIMRSFQYGKYKDIGYLAVEKYLYDVDKHGCVYNQRGADSIYSLDSAYFASRGYNTADSALPPLDSLGLGILLKNGVHSPVSSLPTKYLVSFTSSPNPFIKETTLEFTLNRMSYVTLEVYDELGRLVWGDGKGSSLEAGSHAIHLEGSTLPSGTLYARIATGFGEVKTVVLVHDK